MLRLSFYLYFIFLLPAFSFAQDQKILDSLHNILKNAKDDTTKTHILNELAWEHKYSNPEQALKYAGEALALAEKTGKKNLLARSLSNFGVIYYLQGEYATALTYHLKSLKIVEERNDKPAIASSYNNIGAVYEAQKQYDEALKYHTKALELREELKEKSGIAASLINIGNVNYFKNNYKEATEYYLKALKIVEKIGEKDRIAGIMSNIGATYLDRKMYPEALDYHKKALDIRIQEKDKFGIASSLNNIGILYTLKHDYPNALKYLQAALDTSNAIGAKDIALETYMAFSQAYTGLGNYQKALDYFGQYSQTKDSLYNTESSRQIAEMQTKYETEKKEKEIQLLNKDKALQDVEIKRQNTIRSFLFGIVGLIVLLGLVLLNAYRNKQKANTRLQVLNSEVNMQKEEIETQKSIVDEKNKEITDSIKYAKRIQEAILPDTSFIYQNLKDSFVLYKPKDIVSGDFYWFAKTDTAIVFAAADCTGHGVPGAFMSMVGNDMLNHIINDRDISSPGHALSELDLKVKNALKQSGEEKETTDGMDIALCAYYPETNKLQFAGAFRPLLLIRNEMIKEYPANKYSIGGHTQNRKVFTEHEISLIPGDCIYLFSDGYVDQFGGKEGKKFKTKNFKEMLLEIHKLPMKEQAKVINGRIKEWKGGLEQVDDILVMGVRF